MRVKHVSALVLPFLLGAFALRLAIAPLGDAIARSIAYVAPKPARPSMPPSPGPALPLAIAEGETDGVMSAAEADGDVGGLALALPRRSASRTPSPRRETVEGAKDAGAEAGAAPSLTDAPKGTIVVSAGVVTRALERRDVGATNAVGPDGAPLGARLAGVSRYRTGLRDGDVVVSVGGRRTPTVDAMVGAAMQSATNGASHLSGRILRGDAIFAVVLELPK